MILRREYTNSEWWYCIFVGDDDVTVLVATVPGVGCYDIAMVLSPEEKELVTLEDKDDLTRLARDVVASRDMPAFKKRVFIPERVDVDTMELPDKELKRKSR